MDESTGASVVAYLRREGHDAEAVVERMPGATDSAIMDWALSEQRILITNDKDFGEMVFRSGWAHRGVVLLRLRDERVENKVWVVKAVLAQVGERLHNRYVVATESGIRVRS